MDFARRTLPIALLLCTALNLLSPRVSWGRDMQGRIGLGYNAQFANSTPGERVPGVSVKYGLTRDIAAEAVVGIATTSPSNTVAGAKFFKNLFYETNLNFYTMLGAALLNAQSHTGCQFIGGFGVEFFIPGIESLGFSVETGGSFDNVSGSFALKTLGVSFLEAGIHFYF